MDDHQDARCVLSWRYLKDYFEHISDNCNNLEVQFQGYLPKAKIISLAKISNSNLKMSIEVT